MNIKVYFCFLLCSSSYSERALLLFCVFVVVIVFFPQILVCLRFELLLLI